MTSRLVLSPTQTTIEWVSLVLSLGVKWPQHKADRSSACSAEGHTSSFLYVCIACTGTDYPFHLFRIIYTVYLIGLSCRIRNSEYSQRFFPFSNNRHFEVVHSHLFLAQHNNGNHLRKDMLKSDEHTATKRFQKLN